MAGLSCAHCSERRAGNQQTDSCGMNSTYSYIWKATRDVRGNVGQVSVRMCTKVKFTLSEVGYPRFQSKV